jgi:hypothetical protein
VIEQFQRSYRTGQMVVQVCRQVILCHLMFIVHAMTRRKFQKIEARKWQ